MLLDTRYDDGIAWPGVLRRVTITPASEHSASCSEPQRLRIGPPATNRRRRADSESLLGFPRLRVPSRRLEVDRSLAMSALGERLLFFERAGHRASYGRAVSHRKS